MKMTPARLWNLLAAVGATVALLFVYGLETASPGLVPDIMASVIRITVVVTWIGYLAATFSDRLGDRIDARTADILNAIDTAGDRDGTNDRDAAATTEAHLEALRALKEHGGRRPQLVR